MFSNSLDLEHIPRISRKLSEADPLWLKDFLLADGLVYIYTMLHTYVKIWASKYNS
jgi:hypothetical protein